MLTSKNDISKEGVKYNLICKIQDFITKDLTFGANQILYIPMEAHLQMDWVLTIESDRLL